MLNGIIMNNIEIAEHKEISKSMYKDVCDPTSLISVNLQELTMKALIKLFLSTKASKTDFGVVIELLEFWDKETSIIYIESYSFFRSITKSNLSNANLSRALKSLEEKGFIRNLGANNRLEYLFDVPFSILRSEST
jgi:hypothetical protein